MHRLRKVITTMPNRQAFNDALPALLRDWQMVERNNADQDATPEILCAIMHTLSEHARAGNEVKSPLVVIMAVAGAAQPGAPPSATDAEREEALWWAAVWLDACLNGRNPGVETATVH